MRDLRRASPNCVFPALLTTDCEHRNDLQYSCRERSGYDLASKIHLCLIFDWSGYMNKTILVCMVFLALFWTHPGKSKPMEAPQAPGVREYGIKQANWIVEASFIGYDPPAKDTSQENIYMDGIKTRYLITKVLKSQTPNSNIAAGKTIPVQYYFHDFSPCMADTSFCFKPERLPSPKSKWILILTDYFESKQIFVTWRGEEGRLPDTEISRKLFNTDMQHAP